MQQTRTGTPTHAQVTAFLQSFFPARQRDVPFLYHTPQSTHYEPIRALVDRIVLSVTPTRGVYELINDPTRLSPSLCFLHRPFDLDRHAVRPGTLILASHTAFDEVLTVGWNVALAGRLSMDVPQCVRVQGYKGDLERRIGIVGRVPEITRDALVNKIRADFGGVGDLYSPDPQPEESVMGVIAIMNAFGRAEVERVVEITRAQDWITSGKMEEECGRGLLYLTGAPRQPGLEAAQSAGVNVVCVGHQACEEWGIRYLGSMLRARFRGLQVEEVFEEEVAVRKKGIDVPSLPLQHDSEAPSTTEP